MGKVLQREVHKLDPRLRMIANGDEEVNTLRAEQAPDVAVQRPQLLQASVGRGLDAKAVPRSQLDDFERTAIEATPDDVYVNVIIQLKEDAGEIPKALRRYAVPALRRRVTAALRGGGVIDEQVRRDNLLAVAVPLGILQDLLDDPDVVAVESPEQIHFAPPIEVRASPTGPGNARLIASAPDHPNKVLIGIIDVGGFDFAHPDFLDEQGDTRFVRIWDQGGDLRPSPRKFGYGAEINQAHMNAALRAHTDPRFGIPATDLEPQSQMVIGSHGTHVASIAAANSGVCPQSYIAGVLISIPEDELERRKSFYDSTRIAHAVEYLFDLSRELSQETGTEVPVSLNISLGTNGHAHDASSATSRWIDHALTTAGRSICVAAGNAGQEEASHPTDWGFVMGRIHTSGQLSKEGDSKEIEWIVFGDGIADLSENELEIWYSSRDHLAVQLKPPGSDWLTILEPGQFIENQELPDGMFVSVYNELYKAANGLNYIACYLSPLFSQEGIVGVKSGTWKVRLIARQVRDGDFHAWIERDDPHPLGGYAERQAWFFPSFFSRDSNVDNSSVSSLACGHNVIAVANLDERASKIHKTSSQGPTRDGRHKPEIAAPGTNIVAAKGFDPEEMWISMTGTSMASPYVAGVVGLMLSANPELTAAQIGGILRRTASPLKNNFKWQDDAGYGRIDPEACLSEIVRFSAREDRTP